MVPFCLPPPPSGIIQWNSIQRKVRRMIKAVEQLLYGEDPLLNRPEALSLKGCRKISEILSSMKKVN